MSLDFENLATELRMIQSQQTDLSDEDSRRLALEEERRSLVVCTSCYQPFSLLYRRRLVCSSCVLGVCRACATFSPTSKLWTCRKCLDRRPKQGRRVGWISGGNPRKRSYLHRQNATVGQLRGGGEGGVRGVEGGGVRMESEVRSIARQMTVDFVTINYDGVSGGEDDSSVSSSSRPSSATFSISSGSDKSMMSTSVSPTPGHSSDVVNTNLWQNLTSHEGKIVTLECSVSGSRPIDVAWFKQSDPLPKSAKYWIHRKKDSHFLTIFDLLKEDCGSYRCVAFNKSAELWHSIELTVKGTRRADNPPELLVYPESLERKVGEEVTMVCQAQGYPEPRLEFFKDGKRIRCNENHVIEYNGHGEWSLTVGRCGAREAGEYTVTAENRFGSSTRDWKLRVRPSQPPQPPQPCPRVTPQTPQDVTTEDSNEEIQSCKTKALCRQFEESTGSAVESVGAAQKPNHKIENESPATELRRESISPRAVDPAPAPGCTEREALQVLSISTLTGSLADREHRKWIESAVRLQNNPYSEQSITRRQIGRSSSFLETNRPEVEPRLVESDSVTGEQQKIYCGLRSVNAARYNRDYFINDRSADCGHHQSQDLSFSPQEVIHYDRQQDNLAEWSGDHSEERDNDSIGESKYWDSGVGSSSERTSTSYFSVSDGIRIYEEEIARRYQPSLRSSVSVDSLIVESPPPLPARRQSLKKVSYAENDLHSRGAVNHQHETPPQSAETNGDLVNDNEEDLHCGSIPRLPSVKDLAAIFQPRQSPDPKPRKSVMKKKSLEQRFNKGSRQVGGCYQTPTASTNTHARSNHILEFEEFRARNFADTIEECDEEEEDEGTEVKATHGGLNARLRTDGVSVSYHVPQPPQLSEEEDSYQEFLARVKNSCSMLTGSLRRSDTSSATLPVTWSSSSLDPSPESSQDSLGLTSTNSTSSPPTVQGPVILLGDNFDPQVMTEDYQACPPPCYSTATSRSTSESGEMYYATFIPDSCVMEDKVSIVCNGYTQIETDSHNTTASESEDQAIVADVVSKEKAWTSSVKLPTLLDFWERRNNNKGCQFKKYASESNISKNQELPENGLRKIPKEKNFTSCEESFNEESDYSVRSGYEDHIYQRIESDTSAKRNVSMVQDESGFFSYENNNRKSPEEKRNYEKSERYYEDDISEPTYACVDWSRDSLNRDSENSCENNVTVIAVDFNHTNLNNNNILEDPGHDKPAILTTSVKDLRRLFETNPAQQVTNNKSTVASSLTARSVPRMVRRDLSAGTSLNTVRITQHTEDSNKVHIVYDSRSESPEHVGIPAVPVKVFSARQEREAAGYTSDESCQGASVRQGDIITHNRI